MLPYQLKSKHICSTWEGCRGNPAEMHPVWIVCEVKNTQAAFQQLQLAQEADLRTINQLLNLNPDRKHLAASE